MKTEEKVSWGIYWVGIAFILTCLAMSVTAKAEDNPVTTLAKGLVSAVGEHPTNATLAFEDAGFSCLPQSRLGSVGIDGLTVMCAKDEVGFSALGRPIHHAQVSFFADEAKDVCIAVAGHFIAKRGNPDIADKANAMLMWFLSRGKVLTIVYDRESNICNLSVSQGSQA